MIATDRLTAAEMEVLAFERHEWGYDPSPRFGVNSQGRKQRAVLERFGLSLARYYQALDRIIDEPAAVVYDPELVHRLQRIRAQRSGGRRRAERRPA